MNAEIRSFFSLFIPPPPLSSLPIFIERTKYRSIVFFRSFLLHILSSCRDRTEISTATNYDRSTLSRQRDKYGSNPRLFRRSRYATECFIAKMFIWLTRNVTREPVRPVPLPTTFGNRKQMSTDIEIWPIISFARSENRLSGLWETVYLVGFAIHVNDYKTTETSLVWRLISDSSEFVMLTIKRNTKRLNGLSRLRSMFLSSLLIYSLLLKLRLFHFGVAFLPYKWLYYK